MVPMFSGLCAVMVTAMSPGLQYGCGMSCSVLDVLASKHAEADVSDFLAAFVSRSASSP